MKSISNSKGFSIPDIIMGLFLSVIIVGVSYNFYTASKLVWAYTYAQSNMQRDAMISLEKIIHGTDTNRKGIAEAQDILTPSASSSDSQIQFEDSVGTGTSRWFYLQNNQLVYMDENNNVSNILDGDVQTLTFTRPNGRDNLVNIDLTLQRLVLDKTITVNVSTSVELRNYDGT
jgi:hypothetical protein